MKRGIEYLREITRKNPCLHELTSDESKKLKLTLLEMYRDINEVCDKYNLSLMVSGGTCLGAVRHHGFIPWDDDLDVMMSREDYDVFVSVFETELSDKYSISVPQKSKEPDGLFMKIYKKGTKMTHVAAVSLEKNNGISVDVFPIERMPDVKLFRELKFRFLDLLRILVLSPAFVQRRKNKNGKMYEALFLSCIKSRIYYYSRYFVGWILMPFGAKNLIDLYDKFASSSKGNIYRSIPTGRGMSKGECHPSEVFFPPRKATFEDLEVQIPNQYDIYLTSLYGDYMKLPPLEKREKHFYVELDFGENVEVEV